MKTIKLSNSGNRVVFVTDGDKAIMHNSIGEDLRMTATDAEERIATLRAAGWK